MTAPKIHSVQPLEGKQLLVVFANGVRKIYDCKQLLHLEPFKVLANEALFRSVTADPGGYGISWNDNVDLSEYELWVNSKETALVK